MSRAQYLPPELLLDIYTYLAPRDYDAARRTCHHWLDCSRNLTLLRTMAKRGGWSQQGLSDDTRSQLQRLDSLSARTTLECTLASAIEQHRVTDTTELAEGDYNPAKGGHCGLGYTTSVCGTYVLLSEGCTIYVYRLTDIGLQAITAIVCPKRVLATTMDASVRRHTVAAILDDRMGMVCDLDPPFDSEVPSPSVYGKEASLEDGLPMHAWETMSRETIGSIHIRSPRQTVSLLNASRSPHASYSAPNNLAPYERVSSIYRGESDADGFVTSSRSLFTLSEPPLINKAPLSIYHSLCSSDDPPRSVAVCPTRRCVAFGCAAGIELHWIDSLSGRNLMKWFPLSAPSDCLYFLPGRRGIDNPNKLRLISSKAGAAQRCGINKFARKNAIYDRRKTIGRYFGSVNWWESRLNRSEPEYDHHNAVPLSDGFHVLFTDPPTGHLCLGSDAPHGGPTKLLRKVRFDPPSGAITSDQPRPATLYAASRDLSHGVRIIAVYGEHLVFYSVPEDVLADINRINGHLIGETEQDPNHWSHWLEHTFVPLPVRLTGKTIGQMSDIVDVAIQSGREPVIWAFGSNGLARTFKVGRAPYIERHAIDRSGSVIDLVDEQGDWDMPDAHVAPVPIPSGKGKSTSVPGAFRDSDNDVDMTDESSEVPFDPWLLEIADRTRIDGQLAIDDHGHEWLHDVPTPVDGATDSEGAVIRSQSSRTETHEINMRLRRARGERGETQWESCVVSTTCVAGYWSAE